MFNQLEFEIGEIYGRNYFYNVSIYQHVDEVQEQGNKS